MSTMQLKGALAELAEAIEFADAYVAKCAEGGEVYDPDSRAMLALKDAQRKARFITIGTAEVAA